MPVMTELVPVTPAPDSVPQDELFPIREVARLTGINPVTLRAWERRYGLIQPTRTESGHRLYSMHDVEAVREILGWIERGVAVSKVGKIMAKNRAAQVQVKAPLDDPQQGEYGQWRDQLKLAVSAFDEELLERLYGQIFSSYALPVVFQDIFLPFWKQLLQVRDDFGQTSEWLFLDGFLRARITQRLLLQRAGQSRQLLLTAFNEQCRELELLVAALMLGHDQIGVRLLGPGAPLEELTLVCEKLQPVALVVFSNHAPTAELPKRLQRLALTLDCPLMLAGDAADLAQDRLSGSPVACLGNDGRLMQKRLRQFLSGRLDT
ncbi:MULTISPECIES: MerR family transcriptional regulator [Pseudomonas]|uniref:MerR family transcriptional regulator n=1 Tax=Pseudomonas protegens TaxID=380021 RepID=A0A7G8YUX7_9PSED|nr:MULTISPECIES: MerR family transcriptional regulator [Pseudomonas]MDP9526950.1 MerR family transcriptional regulator [Pseudomonas protegens]QNH79474.1 MerR family transcriptional regulator [Pseudomonas protegens]QNL08671.1 MerR family transcriptional regulator [Pseudomonas protegens]RBJ84485.1 MerR family transcriptional regulator [Pseudomonas sp. MWU12-2534b]